MLALSAFALGAIISPVRVERSRDTATSTARGVSTTLDTNGKGKAQTALDAERAFAADAQTLGQWTAFRKWAASDATMFVPQPINAQHLLKPLKDPPKAIEWWPTTSYVSCDGKTAVNTGGWRRPDGSVGYFTTVWQRQANGQWQWVLDHGDALDAPRASVDQPGVITPDCRSKPELAVVDMMMLDTSVKSGSGRSADTSLQWLWEVQANGARRVAVKLWDGDGYSAVLEDRVAAPTAPK